MNKNKKIIYWLPALAVMALGFSGASYANDQGRQGYNQMGKSTEMSRHGGRFADKLDLSKEQRQQLKQIHRDARPAMLKLKDAMQDNREAMRELDPGDSAFLKKTAKLADEKGRLITQMINEHAKVRAKVYNVLTPEQRAKAKQLRSERRGKGMHRRGGDERQGSWK
ncbi:MAG TPA: Spy/CpxP family protein refolding chaperone [Mariprofundaceae bacterium]|nr:Spy/CpxP family protein refolding chaperone [Mariprofundaceae bacterium]